MFRRQSEVREVEPVVATSHTAAHEGERGFTLLESAIAMLILLIGCLAAVSLFSLATSYNTSAYDRTLGQMFAQKAMEEVRSTPFDDLEETEDESYSGDGRPFTVSTEVCETAICGGSSSIKRVTVTVAPVNGNSAWARTPFNITTLRSTRATGPYYGP